ncbi:MAG TPA: EamA family transporter [Ktedonobacteraceae bacterium]|nr:EamA family transporter [Ktedonobacteraceae bacterium]
MPPLALGLLLVAAVMHATWNLLVKRAREKQVFTWLALLIGAICYLPVVVFNPIDLRAIWPFIVCSALVEAIYYFALISAYQYGDFSLIYPIARGAAPAFLLAWTALFLGERPRLFGVIGIILLVLGLMLVGGNAWWELRKQASLRSVSKNGLALALSVALCISIYTTIDGAAVRHVDPLPYVVVVMSLATILLSPAILRRYGTSAVAKEWRANWPRILMVGIFNLLAYALVLFAYTMMRVSYAGAIREVSVVFAALIGWLYLRETFGALRVAGSVLIFSGILVIALVG